MDIQKEVRDLIVNLDDLKRHAQHEGLDMIDIETTVQSMISYSLYTCNLAINQNRRIIQAMKTKQIEGV